MYSSSESSSIGVGGQNPSPFNDLDANDPRIPYDLPADAGGDRIIGQDGSTPQVVQLEYPSRDADLPLATGIEARLIETARVQGDCQGSGGRVQGEWQQEAESRKQEAGTARVQGSGTASG